MGEGEVMMVVGGGHWPLYCAGNIVRHQKSRKIFARSTNGSQYGSSCE